MSVSMFVCPGKLTHVKHVNMLQAMTPRERANVAKLLSRRHAKIIEHHTVWHTFILVFGDVWSTVFGSKLQTSQSWCRWEREKQRDQQAQIEFHGICECQPTGTYPLPLMPLQLWVHLTTAKNRSLETSGSFPGPDCSDWLTWFKPSFLWSISQDTTIVKCTSRAASSFFRVTSYSSKWHLQLFGFLTWIVASQWRKSKHLKHWLHRGIWNSVPCRSVIGFPLFGKCEVVTRSDSEK